MVIQTRIGSAYDFSIQITQIFISVEKYRFKQI